MPSAVKKGITTIIWGTDNIANAPAGAIVESGKITPKNGAPIEIEDNNGFAASIVFLDDGFDATLNALYDTNKAWPGSAGLMTLSIPTYGGNGGNTSYPNCLVMSAPEIDLQRKKEAMITYKIMYRPGVTT